MDPRRNLVIACVGDGSLHPGWLEPAKERQSFALMLIYYGDTPDRYRDQCDYYVARKGSKWELLSSVLGEQPQLLADYDAIWLPDDDIRTDAATIARMFRLFAAEHCALAQPALTRDSYFSHKVTLQRRWLTLRYTAFAEVMVPLFRSDVLQRLLPTFTVNRSGWGIDHWWSHQIREHNWGPIAILDAAAVTHTRPINTGGGFYKALGIDPQAEYDQLMADKKLKRDRRVLGLKWGPLRLRWQR